MSEFDWGFDWDSNPDESPVGSGTSPFIDAPGLVKAYIDHASIKAGVSSQKGTSQIAFTLVEVEPTEGVSAEQYGGRKKSDETIYFTPKTWGSKDKEGVTRLFFKKLFLYVYGKEKGNFVAQKLAEVTKGKSPNDAIVLVRDIFEKALKELTKNEKKPIWWLFEADISYTAKDDGSGYWRNVYPSLHMMGSTLRAGNEDGYKELKEYYDKAVAKAEEKGKDNPFINDPGEPKSSGGGFSMDTSFDNTDMTGDAPTESGSEDTDGFF